MRVNGVVFLIVTILSFVDSQAIKSLAVFAATSVIYGDFAANSGKIDIVKCGTSPFSEKLVDHLLRRRSESLSIQLSTCDAETVKLNTSTLLVFESPEIFAETARIIKWQTSKYNRYRHLVHIQNGTTDGVTKTIQDGWSIDNVAFLVNETEDSIELATSYMFTATKCRENQLVTINRFRRNTMKWENDNFFPQKYRDMRGCPLTVLKAAQDIKLDVFRKIMLEMSYDLKFRIAWIEVHEGENISVEIIFDFYKMLFFGRGDPVFNFIVVDLEKSVLFVPRGELLTAFEKLLSPFDLFTWISIFSTLLFIFVFIQVTSFVSKSYRDKIFGRGIGSPSMNLLNIFFCGGQTQVPDTSIARFVFLNLIIWSLIIRTCFQSLSYRALQLDSRHPHPSSVDEMLKNDFKRYSVTGNILPDIDFHRIPIDPELIGRDPKKWMDAVAEPTNRKVVFATLEFLDMLEKLSYRSGKTSVEVSDVELATQEIHFPIPSFSPFYQVFEETMQRLIESGICPSRLDALTIPFKGRNNLYDEEIPALVLSMDDLGVGFYACLVPLALSALVFIVEIIYSKVKRTITEYLTMFAVLTFIRTSHPGI